MDSIVKTELNTSYGQFEYLVLPMGLVNAPETFHKVMNLIFSDYNDLFMDVYLDGLLSFSMAREEDLVHIETIRKRLKKIEHYVSPKKCCFMETETEVFGLLVGKKEICTNP